jgi:FtsP/CotA-like multicopper oxidase with cupredoxin domain
MSEGKSAMQPHPATEDDNPLVDMQATAPTPRLDDPGIGLRDNGRHVLTYPQLRSVFEDPDGREPSRTIELHLTGHMEKFTWHFNGVKFSDAEPLVLKYGERLRITLVTCDRKFFGTADLARSQGEDPSKARLTVGVRTWF